MESATVVIESILVKSGWQNVKADIGKFSVGPDKVGVFNLQTGKRYAIEYTTKDGEYGPKHYLQKATLLDAAPATNGHTQEAPKAAPVAHSNGNGKDEAIKALSIQRDSVLCAIATLEAFGRANLLPANRDEIRTLLQAELASYRLKFSKDLGV